MRRLNHRTRSRVKRTALLVFRGAAVVYSDEATYTIDLSHLPGAYGDISADVRGLDGGAFVDFRPTAAGDSTVAYQHGVDGSAGIEGLQFSVVWFGHRGVPQCAHVVAAYYCRNPDAPKSYETWGWTYSDHPCSYIAVGAIQHYAAMNPPMDASAAVAGTTVHEIGHLFRVHPSDDSHNHTPCWNGQDHCIMCYTEIADDGISLFCADCLFQVRR